MTRVFHPEARTEYLESVRYYTQINAALGRRFSAAVERVIAGILEDPQRWRLCRGGVRRRVLRQFPYAIFYRPAGDAVFFLAVAHCSREPEYCRHRAP